VPFIHGCVVDELTGQLLEAKVHILDAGGRPVAPPEAVSKVGPGRAGFYTAGEFTVEVPSGLTTILVEKGTEYEPFEATVQAHAGLPVELIVPLPRWTHLPDRGWYPGNTHIHYDEHEDRPDQRLSLDPCVHDLHVTVVSILQRGELPYAVNKYPVGLLTDFSSAHHVVDCGEENRHNQAAWEIGYGHVILLRLREAVLPVSRGILIGAGDPDYPPLCYACDEARRQGGLAIWCHNGAGMEAPVAAILGKLDAFNLFDPYWVMPEEYTIWYHLLNCGIDLPASTGSDWYICSNNRVYARCEGNFTYESWLNGLQAGRTFITNGPALFLQVNDSQPGDTLSHNPDSPLEIEVSWQSWYPLHTVELVFNGTVLAAQVYPDGSRRGQWRLPFVSREAGWLAARVFSRRRDSFYQPLFAHTSPVRLQAGHLPPARAASAAFFVKSLAKAADWVRLSGKFNTERQQSELLDLFKAARAAYQQLARH
jgi:hypothetical protein